MIERQIQQLIIGQDDSLQIGFYTPSSDLKAVGVAQLHTLLVPPLADYADEITAVLDAIKHLVADVLEDWENLEAEEPE